MWRNLLKVNVAYAVGTAANSLALFLLIPYLVNALTPAEYGAWTLFEVVILLLNITMLAGLDVGMMRYYASSDAAEQARLVGSAILGVAVVGAGFVGLGVVALGVGLRPGVPDPNQASLLVLAIAWAESMFAMLLNVFRIREQAITYVAVSIGRVVLFMGGSIALVHGGHGLTGALAGRLIATVVGIVVAAVLARRAISLRVSWSSLRLSARYGLPLLPAGLASYILFAADRYLLGYYTTLDTVAVYSFAYKIAAILDILVTRPFATDWVPRRFKIAERADAPRQYAQMLTLYLVAALGFTLLVAAAAPVVYALVAPPLYRSGASLVPVLLLAYLIYGLSNPLNVGIMLENRTGYMPIIGWLAAGAYAGLLVLWIPRYGMMGAAWATVVAYAIWTGGITWASLRLYAVPYSISQIAWALGLGAIGYAGLWWLDTTIDAHLVAEFAVKLAWLALVALVGFYRFWWRSRVSRRVDDAVAT